MRRFVLLPVLIAGCSFTALATPSAVASAKGLRSTVLLVGRPAGFQETVGSRDGALQVTFEFSDRGRGPHLESRIAVDAKGLPVRLQTVGRDYLGAPVDERFGVEEGAARWRDAAGEGTVEWSGTAFYVGLDAVPEQTALLARALLGAPGKTLDLLPGGRATITRVGAWEVVAGSRRLIATLYEVGGLGFEPTPVWLDADGGLFASVSEWLSVVREGWEPAVPTLLTVQRERREQREREQVASLAHRPGAALAIKGASLFDAESAVLRPGMTVLIEGERITAVGRDGTVRLPAGAETIDARGKTLLPGLWDMHTHVSGLDGPLDIAAGVTSVRDLANDIDVLRGLERRWAEGEAIGPRVVKAGFMDGPGPYAGPTKVLVATPEEAVSWVDRYADMGYEQIKIYSSVRPELVPAIVERAHARGLRVSGHIPAGMWAEDAVRAGFDEIQHANMLFLNFYKDVEDTRTPARFVEVARRGADLDLESPEVEAFVDLLAARQVVVDPTVTIFEGMFTDRPGVISASYAAVADRLPLQVRRGLSKGGLAVPEGQEGRYRASFRRMLELVGLLWRRGVRLVAGTDGLAGFTLHRELELYVEAGIPPGQVLALATLGAARVAGRGAELGSIVPGKLADLVLVDGNPVAEIGDIRRIETVVKDGVVYDAAALYRTLGVR